MKNWLPSAFLCENKLENDVHVLYISSHYLEQARCASEHEKLCVRQKNVSVCVCVCVRFCTNVPMCANFMFCALSVTAIRNCFAYCVCDTQSVCDSVCVCLCVCNWTETGGDCTHFSTTTEMVASSFWSALYIWLLVCTNSLEYKSL